MKVEQLMKAIPVDKHIEQMFLNSLFLLEDDCLLSSMSVDVLNWKYETTELQRKEVILVKK